MTWGTLFLLSGLYLAYYQRFSERRDIPDRLGVVREGFQQGAEMGLEKWVGGEGKGKSLDKHTKLKKN